VYICHIEIVGFESGVHGKCVYVHVHIMRVVGAWVHGCVRAYAFMGVSMHRSVMCVGACVRICAD
jgi:hypothetical protein